jgi:uncharacterized membrane protein
MSDERYAPPTAALAEPPVRGIQGRIDLGEAFRESWALLWPNFGLLLGTGFVAFLCFFLSAVTIIGLFLVVPVLYWGSCYFTLEITRGRGQLSDVFAGFGSYGETLGQMMSAAVLLFLMALVGQSVDLLGRLTHSGVLQAIGGLVNLVWTFGVMARLTLVWFFVVDQRLSGLDAIRACWEATADQKLICIVLVLLNFILPFAGFLFLIVGVIPGILLAGLLHGVAYRQLSGR